MKICEDLRRAVLQAAIQGKLTEQRAEDGTAEDLLKEIRKEKEKLIAEGKIKREKVLSPIKDDEKPFDIPESWVWARLGEISNSLGDGLHGTPVFTDGPTNYPFINGNNLSDKKITIKRDTKFVNEKEYRKYSIPLSLNTLLLSINGTIGNIAYYNGEEIVLGKSACFIDICQSIPRKYIEIMLRTLYFLDYASSKSTKTTISNLGLLAIRRCPVPLPPLAEQHRIVEHVDALMSKINELEKVEDELEAMKKNFPGDLRDALLQAAIQGKLTEQRAEDGTAENLLKEIRKEKARLIADGKIKKEKSLPPIKDDEKPFEIPDNWVWVRLGDVCETNIGLTYKPSDISKNGTLVLRSSNIQKGKIDYKDSVYVSTSVPNSALINKGDILICVRNGSRKLVGKSAIVDKDGMAFGAFMAKIHSNYIKNRYIQYYIESHVFRGGLDGVGTETINQITQKMLKESLIPLPPLAEQHRIVERLNELLPLCETMKGQEE